MDQNAFKPRWPIAALLLTTRSRPDRSLPKAACAGSRPRRRPSIEVFVQLNTPSVAELNAASAERRPCACPIATQRAQPRVSAAEQEQFRSQLAAQGAVDALDAARRRERLPRARVDAIRYRNACAQLPGVRTVGRVETAHARQRRRACRGSARLRSGRRIGRRRERVDRHHRHRHRLHACRLRRPRHRGRLRRQQQEHHRAGHVPDREGQSAASTSRARPTTRTMPARCRSRMRIRWTATATARTSRARPPASAYRAASARVWHRAPICTR